MRAPELMARLNPPNIRFDIGRGGLPELTAQDIAAAIGLMQPGLGRELICRLWWPDGAKLAPKEIDRLLMDAQFEEWKDRMDAVVTAQIKERVHKGLPSHGRALAELETAQARMWPHIGGDSRYDDVRMAVLAEMSAACRCTTCKGRRFVLTDAKITKCQACDGTGRVQVSGRARAEMLRTDVANYSRRWRSVYEWTLDLCTELVGPACKEFERIAGRR